jgi:hypothetical protein
MYIDPIVDEIHRFREQLLAQHGGDFAAYFDSLLKAQRISPQQYTSFVQIGPDTSQVSVQFNSPNV